MCPAAHDLTPSMRRTLISNRGFTLIELLVVVFVLGLLSTLALPSVFHQLNKAKESEARTYVSAINRGQQAYFVQYNQFGTLAELELGIPTATRNYLYTSQPSGNGGGATANTTATPANPRTLVRGFAGKAWIGLNHGSVATMTIVCEGDLGNPPTIVGTTCP